MEQREAIAVIGLTNVASVHIYDISHGIEDEVLAGINSEKPEWCVLDGSEFTLGELVLSLDDAIRI